MTDIVERLRDGDETCGIQRCITREARSGCTCAEAADEIERLREEMQRIAFNALKRHMILGKSQEQYIAMMEANNSAALWQCLEHVGQIAKRAFERGE